MKRNLLTLLMILVMHSIMAQTTIVCNAEGELPHLLQKKAGASELKICGPVSTEDIRAINNHTAIKYLDLTEAKLSVIPEKAWTNLHSLEWLYLPKTIDTLYLDAMSCDIDEIEIYLPGQYPHLKNYPIDCEKKPWYKWYVTEDNELLTVEEFATVNETLGGIFSADKKILYKAIEDYRYGMTICGDVIFSVEKVWDYAFAGLFGADYLDIILYGIKEISNNAFCDMLFAYSTGDLWGRSGLCISLVTDTPPKKIGEGNLNHNVRCKDELIFWVSDIDLYIQDDPSWAELNLKDSNGIRWGTHVESIPSVNRAPTPYYDLQGRKVVNPKRGIYIKDGRKVVIGQ